jgi:predicted lipoprotein
MILISKRRPVGCALALLLAAVGCGGGGGPPSQPDATPIDFDRQAMLRHLGEHVVIPTLTAFAARADELVTAVDAQCAALGTGGEASAQAAAQGAWRAAMLVWQEAELMQFGPAMAADPHDYIYSWPTTSSCAVDQDVMLRWTDPAAYDIGTRLTNRRGLPALEYVLFSTSLAVTCAPQAAPAGWSELSDADKQAARCGFARAAAGDLASKAHALLDAWLPTGGNYLDTLAHAGDGGSPYASAHAAINEVSNAMFYLDTDVKDMKVAEPAGITINACGATGQVCLAELESPWAPHSKENVIANLRGLRMLFTGEGPDQVAGPAFDDFLVAVGASDLAASMTVAIDSAIAKVEAIPGTLGEAVVNDPAAVLAAHMAIKAVNDAMKTQFLTVLALELPADLGDDTD